MQKYFYTDGASKFGPFTLDELKAQGITRETLVWFNELDDWKPAGEVGELSSVFDSAGNPPPVSNAGTSDSSGSAIPGIQPKTYLTEAVLATFFCCLPLGIVAIVQASRVETRFKAGDVAGAQDASKKAKDWATASFVLGLVGTVVYVILMVMAEGL